MLVATIKPGRNVHSKIRRILSLGIQAFRVNFARSEVEHNLALLRYCSDLNEKSQRELTVLADLPGPKIRLGLFRKGREQLEEGQAFSLDLEGEKLGDCHRGYISTSMLHGRASVGDRLALSSGALLEIVSKSVNELRCRVVQEGKVYNKCGIWLAGRYEENTRLNDQDREVLAVLGGLTDFVCPSFVDNVSVVREVRNHPGTVAHRGIIAKVESPVGVSNLPSIAAEAQGLMLCRGDLRRFFSPGEVEDIGVEIALVGRKHGKVVAFATDYFSSMVDGAPLSNTDLLSLKRALELQPDYLIINETSYSDAWFAIAQTAVKIHLELYGDDDAK